MQLAALRAERSCFPVRLQGVKNPAQGNALGERADPCHCALKGHQRGRPVEIFRPYRAQASGETLFPRALPWAAFLQPFRLSFSQGVALAAFLQPFRLGVLLCLEEFAFRGLAMARRKKKRKLVQPRPSSQPAVAVAVETPQQVLDRACGLAVQGELTAARRLYEELQATASEPRLQALVRNDLAALDGVDGA